MGASWLTKPLGVTVKKRSKQAGSGRLGKTRATSDNHRGQQAERAAFLAPFAALLNEVHTAQQADVYPFYPCVRPHDSAERHPRGTEKSDDIILVANDYLGLAMDRRVRDAAREAIAQFGTSRCASPIAGGYTRLHRALEAGLAGFLCQEAVALFASGYQANVGIISALMRQGDLIVTDLLNHASIIDGARLSGAEVRFFQHNSSTHLEGVLEREGEGRRVLVIVEGVYSADGDIVRLPDIVAVAHAHAALVMIDEAHSLGVLGAGGRGAAEHFGLLQEVDVIMGTMSKSLASVGGFVAADRQLVDVVRHNARSLIFSAALPPAGVAASLTALEILEGEPERRHRLWHNAHRFLGGLKTCGFDTMRSETPVIPILVGDPGRTLEFGARLRDRGVLVCPAVPPMVQAHLSRIRAHVTASHDDAVIDLALNIVDDVGSSLRLRRGSSQAQSDTSEARVVSASVSASPGIPG